MRLVALAWRSVADIAYGVQVPELALHRVVAQADQFPDAPCGSTADALPHEAVTMNDAVYRCGHQAMFLGHQIVDHGEGRFELLVFVVFLPLRTAHQGILRRSRFL